jgi:hypothetical protein
MNELTELKSQGTTRMIDKLNVGTWFGHECVDRFTSFIILCNFNETDMLKYSSYYLENNEPDCKDNK